MLRDPSINMLVLGNKQGIRFKVKPKETGIGSFNRERLWSGHHHRRTWRGDKGAECQPISPTLNPALQCLNWSLQLGQEKGSQMRDIKPLKMSLDI